MTMSDRAQLDRLYDAADQARSALLLAHSELIFGGDWQSARARIEDAGARLDKVMNTVARTLGRDDPRLSFSAILDLDKQ